MVGIREDGKTRDVRGVGVLLRKWEVDFLVSVDICVCTYENIQYKLSLLILTLLSVYSGACPLCKEETQNISDLIKLMTVIQFNWVNMLS